MEPISTDKKLALLQQIRQEQRFNQTKLHDRAAFLYGLPAEKNTETHPPLRSGPGSTFKLRLILSILLVSCVFACHYLNKSVFGYCAKDLDDMIAQEMIQAEEFYETFSFEP